jgi:hypothetical protein
MQSIYDFNPAGFEAGHADCPTKDYMEAWNYVHDLEFLMAQKYVQDIRNAQHAASSLAIEQILA